jgi:hypothetical protein
MDFYSDKNNTEENNLGHGVNDIHEYTANELNSRDLIDRKCGNDSSSYLSLSKSDLYSDLVSKAVIS